MKKVLVRSGMLPTDNITFETMIQKNILGTNVGNLVYAYSIYRNLMQGEDTEFVATNYKWRFSQEEIDEFNQDYECFIIPLADAIRPQFVPELRGLTKLVCALKIPCYVIGIGIRAPYDPEPDFRYDFDEDVKAFMDAVLEKSAMIGLRGSITGDYLSRLGYIIEKDYSVIGCPSMYMFGENIRIRDEAITSDSTVCYNLGANIKNSTLDFIRVSASRFAQSYYIPQNDSDLKIMYGGIPRAGCQVDTYPQSITDDIFVNGNARFFPNVPSWLRFLGNVQLSFGSRLHGNVMATLAGTPALFFPHDARQQELVEYHNFTVGGTPYDEINSSTDIFDMIEKSDFHRVERAHRRNFEHYLDFLQANNIPHIYGNGRDSLLTEKEKKAAMRPPLKPITVVETREVAERLDTSYTILNDKYNKQIHKQEKEKTKLQNEIKMLKDEIGKCKNENENLNIENEKLNNELNAIYKWIPFKKRK